MLLVQLALIATLGILELGSLESSPGQSEKLNGDSAKPTEAQQMMRFTLPGPDAPVVGTSRWRRNVTTGHRGTTDRKHRRNGGSTDQGTAIISPQRVNRVMLDILTIVKVLSENFQRLSNDVETMSQGLISHKAATEDSLRKIDAVQERSGEKLTAIETSVSLHAEHLTRGIRDLSHTLRTSSERNGQRLTNIEGRLADDQGRLQQFANQSADRSKTIEVLMRKQGIQLTEIKREAKEAFIKIHMNQKLANRTERILSKFREEVSNNLEDINEALDVMGSTNGRAFLNIENVTKVVEKANTSGHEFVESDSSVIGGYTAQLHLEAKISNKRLQLGVYFRLCPGPKDALLQWPFRRNYSVVIFHPSSRADDVYKTVNFTSPVCAACFEKPKEKCNTGCGFGGLLSWELAKQGGYVHNDTLTIGVSLLPETRKRCGGEVPSLPVAPLRFPRFNREF